jgi:hypothetical protein
MTLKRVANQTLKETPVDPNIKKRLPVITKPTKNIYGITDLNSPNLHVQKEKKSETYKKMLNWD